jgi:hypothetical protein
MDFTIDDLNKEEEKNNKEIELLEQLNDWCRRHYNNNFLL